MAYIRRYIGIPINYMPYIQTWACATYFFSFLNRNSETGRKHSRNRNLATLKKMLVRNCISAIAFLSVIRNFKSAT